MNAARHKLIGLFFLTIFSAIPAFAQLQLLSNGGFESAVSGLTPSNYIQSSSVAGWSTTASDSLVEVWSTGFMGVDTSNGPSTPLGFYDGGQQFAEVNGTQSASLYQDVTFASAGQADYFFEHRGRAGADTLRLSIIYLGLNATFNSSFNSSNGAYTAGGDDSIVYSTTVTTDNVQSAGEYNGWQAYYGDNVFTTVAGGVYRFAFSSVSTASGDNSIGNFIDNAAFGFNLQGSFSPVPEASTYGLAGIGMLGGFVVLRRFRNKTPKA